ncbi:unnamed protein product [Phyllotreta striolata]|uniref:SCP domain-containing protein n=1 Tax=Phyllotreta striolata TaxID=444603 RepID=A0A9N9TME9_PHYSR|nr:unnamed protein product [Phyllotreta striolata]
MIRTNRFGSLLLLALGLLGNLGPSLAGRHPNYFCDLPCKNVLGSYFMNTACQRQNVMCQGGQKCGEEFKVVALNDTDRQYMLDIHNYLRNKVAMGRETRGSQPTAANMNALSYNKELEFMAQCWINECHKESILVHDKCRRTAEFSWVGQNLAYVGSTDPSQLDKLSMIKKMILGWYDEVAEFSSSWVNKHEERDAMIGHYTQLVWADTKEIGCAMSYFAHHDGTYKWYNLKLACNYGPGGNYLGQPVYKIGKTGSKCAGKKTNKRFPGLCGVDVPINRTKNYYNEFFKYYI